VATRSSASRVGGSDLAGLESRRRVLLFVQNLGGGGAERQLVDMANYWAARGVEVTLVTISAGMADFYPVSGAVKRIRLVEDPRSGKVMRVAGLVRQLRAQVIATRPHAVVSFISENNVLALLATRGLGMRTIVSERAHPQYDTSVPAVWKSLRWLLYRRAAVVVAQTRDTASWIAKHCAARVRVIPNALRALPEPGVARGPLMIGVGRLTRQKGFDLLLNAFARLRPRFPEWSAVILGAGPEQQNLARLSEELRIADSVRFPGSDPDVESWMARASLVVQPSRFEGFPNAVLEAMGMGAAVISGDCPSGPSDLITDGVNGRLVPIEDVAALAAAMEQLMADSQARARLGLQARKVQQEYSQEKIMSQWDSIVFGDGEPQGAGA